jgi:hypothetical protein
VRARAVFLAIAIAFVGAGFISAEENAGGGWAEENVRSVQMKLHEAGLYFGAIDGAYSSELAAALGRYQIRNGLPISGQLDAETSKALGAKPAVATTANDQVKSSETWRRLRMGEQQISANRRETSPSGVAETGSGTEIPAPSAAAATTPSHADTTRSASSSPVVTSNTSSASPHFSKERLRDYVGAFVLAGLDPHVGSETDFFADHVRYYNDGIKDHEKIRKDLQRYATRWPDRRFWLDGDITVEPQNGNRVRVTFPLRYDLRNGGKHSSGKIDKTLVLEPTGDDLQIVAVNERKAG